MSVRVKGIQRHLDGNKLVHRFTSWKQLCMYCIWFIPVCMKHHNSWSCSMICTTRFTNLMYHCLLHCNNVRRNTRPNGVFTNHHTISLYRKCTQIFTTPAHLPLILVLKLEILAKREEHEVLGESDFNAHTCFIRCITAPRLSKKGFRVNLPAMQVSWVTQLMCGNFIENRRKLLGYADLNKLWVTSYDLHFPSLHPVDFNRLRAKKQFCIESH